MWCVLCHWGVQLILAYSWTRSAILTAGNGRGGMFLFLLFLYFHSCSTFFPVPLFHLYYLFYLFSHFLLGWLGSAKVSCILVTRVSNWYWLTVGQGLLSLKQVRVEGHVSFRLFLHFHSCSSFFPVPLFHLLYYLFYHFFSLSLGNDTKWLIRVDVSLNPKTINQSHFLWERTQKNDPQGLTSNTNKIFPIFRENTVLPITVLGYQKFSVNVLFAKHEKLIRPD